MNRAEHERPPTPWLDYSRGFSSMSNPATFRRHLSQPAAYPGPWYPNQPMYSVPFCYYTPPAYGAPIWYYNRPSYGVAVENARTIENIRTINAAAAAAAATATGTVVKSDAESAERSRDANTAHSWVPQNRFIEVAESPKLDYTHFISLPLAIYPQLVEKLSQFQNSVLQDSTCDMDDLGIDRSIFAKLNSLHLSVLMLTLYDEKRVAVATKVLQEISSEVLKALEDRPVSIRLSGLMCTRGSPDHAQVVYAPVTEIGGEGRLLRACQIIIDAFNEAGLVLENSPRRSLKLHVTLMNARFRKRNLRPGGCDSFDARKIFKDYGSQDWGEYLIREVHLSQRFKFDHNGYFHCCASMQLPKDK